MLRIMILVLGWAMSSWVLAEDPPASATDQVEGVFVPFEMLPQDEYLKKYQDDFQKSVQSGIIKQSRSGGFSEGCLKLGGPADYCKCATKVHSEQTDEFLYYDMWYQYWITHEMKLATEAGKVYRYKMLLLQATERDSLNRRIAVACGVIDDATKKVVPFKVQGK